MSEESDVDRETAVTPPAEARQYEDLSSRTNVENAERSEVVKFVVLAAILVGVILVVAFSRSLIFDRILPAIVRTDLMPEPTPDSGIGGAVVEPATAVDVTPAADTVGADNQLFLPTTTTDEEAGDGTPTVSSTAVESSAPPATDAIEPTPTPITHVVQRGENLTKIAQQYNVTTQALLQANGLTNPDYIQAGQVLVIPTP